MSNNENLVKQDISELWKTNTDMGVHKFLG